MSILNEREKGFEAKFAADEQARFTLNAQQTKLIGLWAARKMGFKTSDAESYAKALVRADVEKVGREDVVTQIVTDLTGRGIAVSAEQVRREMQRLLTAE